MSTPTILAAKLAAMKTQAKAETMLSRARASSPRGEFTTLPIVGRVWIELAGEAVVDEIESAVWSAMEALKLPPVPVNMRTYDGRRTALTLAWAVRNPDRIEERAGTQEQWCEMDIDLISACGIVYQDVRERLNPLGDGVLTEDLFEEIRLQHEKKNAPLLRTYGVGLLSIYIASTAAPPANSPTPPSFDGPSVQES
jgi:hypothetical protein